ncbi:MAG: sterol desaturase family protein [Wenzhouxiangellaceae bacterium]|nr:sterol desaturase family protein [Wenzhouxiangellaceae bacterium]
MDMRTQAYRDRYRAENIPDGYSAIRHVAALALLVMGGIGVAVWRIDDVAAVEWLAVPLTFLYANLAEYLGHRYVMHRRVPGLGLIFERHALQHHRFFTGRDMPLGSVRDLRAVLFPPTLLLFFFGAFALPAGLLLTWAFSANVAWLFVATALAYYGSYEVLHTLYHLPDDSRVLRWPFVRSLQRLHREHHDPSCMQSHNFNITWPICDALFGTLDRSARKPEQPVGERR